MSVGVHYFAGLCAGISYNTSTMETNMDDKTVKADLMVVQLDRARTALAEAKTIGETKKIMDMAHAAQIYARRQQLGEEAMAYALAIKIEALRKLGEMLAVGEDRAKVGQPKKSIVLDRDYTLPTLKDIGISKNLSVMAQQLAAMPDEQFEQVREGVQTVSEALRNLKHQSRKTSREAIAWKKVSDPKGQYDLILCDPPWQYDFSETGNREIENQYPTMTVEELENLKIPLSDDCVLFLWATAPKLREAISMIDAWGFQYKTHAIWDKTKIGMGYWFRGQHELLLVATRGNVSPPEQSDRVSSIFTEARTRHSAKPSCVYEWIESAFPNLTKCEMFCRAPRAGWAAWGNEV